MEITILLLGSKQLWFMEKSIRLYAVTLHFGQFILAHIYAILKWPCKHSSISRMELLPCPAKKLSIYAQIRSNDDHQTFLGPGMGTLLLGSGFVGILKDRFVKLRKSVLYECHGLLHIKYIIT